MSVRVRAVTNRILEQEPPTGVETGGIVTTEYDQGVIASIDCSWSQPRTAPTWGGVTLDTLDVIGTAGWLRIAPFNLHVAGHAASGPQSWTYGSDMDADMIDNFVNAVHAAALVLQRYCANPEQTRTRLVDEASATGSGGIGPRAGGWWSVTTQTRSPTAPPITISLLWTDPSYAWTGSLRQLVGCP